ncbi:hypothetical protein ACK8OR_16320 [Jannaschia sp. KMU-145]|uniref:hypothetical protein n=1 Tax=Jannaschia halovivens TaxID=3388667 RepID=UPI00396B2E99
MIFGVVSTVLATQAGANDLDPSVTEGDVANFISAVVDLGCDIVTDDQSRAVEEATGLSNSQLHKVVEFLMRDGQVVSLVRGLRLTTGRCANA